VKITGKMKESVALIMIPQSPHQEGTPRAKIIKFLDFSRLDSNSDRRQNSESL
jgi:hypothetical protein